MLKFITSIFRPAPVVVEKVVYQKDPHGLIARDMAVIRKYAATGKYKVGDCIASVAYRQAQLDLIEMIETKLIAKPQSFK